MLTLRRQSQGRQSTVVQVSIAYIGQMCSSGKKVKCRQRRIRCARELLVGDYGNHSVKSSTCGDLSCFDPGPHVQLFATGRKSRRHTQTRWHTRTCRDTPVKNWVDGSMQSCGAVPSRDRDRGSAARHLTGGSPVPAHRLESQIRVGSVHFKPRGVFVFVFLDTGAKSLLLKRFRCINGA